MKPPILIIALLIIPVVLGYTAGEETVIEHFDKCEELIVNVTATLDISDGEYFLKNCSNINNTWTCNCTDEYDLVLNTTLLTLNKYTFVMDFEYFDEEEEEEETSSDSSNTGGSGSSAMCGSWGECQTDNYLYRECRKGNYIWSSKKSCVYIETADVEIVEVDAIEEIEVVVVNDTSQNQGILQQEDNGISPILPILLTMAVIIGLFFLYKKIINGGKNGKKEIPKPKNTVNLFK